MMPKNKMSTGSILLATLIGGSLIFIIAKVAKPKEPEPQIKYDFVILQ